MVQQKLGLDIGVGMDRTSLVPGTLHREYDATDGAWGRDDIHSLGQGGIGLSRKRFPAAEPSATCRHYQIPTTRKATPDGTQWKPPC